MVKREINSMADALDANPVVIDMLEVAKEAKRAGGLGISDSLLDGVDEIERLETLAKFYKKKFDDLFTAYTALHKQYDDLIEDAARTARNTHGR
jgi:hypothetical protein